MTLPGIPTIYYGTEQGFTVPARGHVRGRQRLRRRATISTRARRCTASSQRATALRREHRVFSRGKPTVLRDNGAGPGVLAYRMQDGDDRRRWSCSTPADAKPCSTTWRPAARRARRLEALFDIDGEPRDQRRRRGRRGSAWCCRHAVGRCGAWRRGIEATPASATRRRRRRAQRRTITLEPRADVDVDGDFEISGRAPGLSRLRTGRRRRPGAPRRQCRSQPTAAGARASTPRA